MLSHGLWCYIHPAQAEQFPDSSSFLPRSRPATFRFLVYDSYYLLNFVMKGSAVPYSRSSAAMRPATAARDVTARFQAAKEPRKGNVEGQFFVDKTCIDCDTCRWMAPGSFTRVGSGSAVTQQPETREDRIQAIQATLSCPTCASLLQHRL